MLTLVVLVEASLKLVRDAWIENPGSVDARRTNFYAARS
jgi:hypothetical protein